MTSEHSQLCWLNLQGDWTTPPPDLGEVQIDATQPSACRSRGTEPGPDSAFTLAKQQPPLTNSQPLEMVPKADDAHADSWMLTFGSNVRPSRSFHPETACVTKPREVGFGHADPTLGSWLPNRPQHSKRDSLKNRLESGAI
jgi:hypothetical protein